MITCLEVVACEDANAGLDWTGCAITTCRHQKQLDCEPEFKKWFGKQWSVASQETLQLHKHANFHWLCKCIYGFPKQVSTGSRNQEPCSKEHMSGMAHDALTQLSTNLSSLPARAEEASLVDWAFIRSQRPTGQLKNRVIYEMAQ